MPTIAFYVVSTPLSVTDSQPEFVLNALKSLSDSVTLSDSVDDVDITWGRNLADSIALLEATETATTRGRDLVDTLSVADGLSAFTINIDIDDTVSFNDSIQDTDFALDEITTPGQLTWRLDFWTDDGVPFGGLNFKDSKQLDYWVNPPIQYLLSEAITTADVDSISIGDEVSTQVNKSLVDSVVLADAPTVVSFAYYANPDDVAILQDQLDPVIRYPGAILLDSISLPDFLTKEIHINLSDSFDFNDQTDPVVGRGVDSLLTINDVVSFNLATVVPRIVRVEEFI